MKQHDDGIASLELTDIIRVNQLVRGRTDFDSFKSWYDSLLSASEQSALIGVLIDFAYQAGFDEQVYQEAVSVSQVAPDNPIVRLAASPDGLFQHVIAQGHRDGYAWLMQLDDSERFVVFSLFVHVFGKAEGRRYQECNKDTCGAWWHRDLSDERVVQAILNDPHYYMTSPRDDALIKAN